MLVLHRGRTRICLSGWPTVDVFTETEHPRGGKGTAKGGQFVAKGEGGGGATASAGRTYKLRPTENRAWTGRASGAGPALQKHELGALGEEIAVSYLKHLGLSDAKPLHVSSSVNFPLDLVGDHEVFEVKTGIASSGTPRWRITIGQPGRAETEWLKSAPPEEKRAWNKRKIEMAIERKHKVVEEISREFGREVRPKTIGIIVDPSTGLADVHVLDGFHSDVGWNSSAARSAYVGSFRYSG